MRPEFRILINGQLQNLERLSNVQQDVASWRATSSDAVLSDAVLLVVHPGGAYGTEQLEDWCGVARQGGGVLFVSGNPVEVEQSIATALAGDSLARDRWRVLATPIRSTDAPEDLRGRLFRFLQTCAAFLRSLLSPGGCWTRKSSATTFSRYIFGVSLMRGCARCQILEFLLKSETLENRLGRTSWP